MDRQDGVGGAKMITQMTTSKIDMGAEQSVCAVATQGKSSGSYLTSYQLSFSTDGQIWTTYQEDGQDKVFKLFCITLKISTH